MKLNISDEKLKTNDFAFASKFNFPKCELTNGKTTKTGSLSCSYFLTLNQSGNFRLNVFHNLFYPETIYNSEIEKITWELLCQGEKVCTGNAASGHPFQLDWDLVNAGQQNISQFIERHFIKNVTLQNEINSQLEELNKHFFFIHLDLSQAPAKNNSEYELKFEFPEFRAGTSAAEVRFSFNNTLPVLDITGKQKSFDGLKKGFNIVTIEKIDSSDILDITMVSLRNNENRLRTLVPQLDVNISPDNDSFYKLLEPGNYPDKEQEVLYLKNLIPVPFSKAKKDEVVNRLKEANNLNQRISLSDIAVIESALDRNYAEKSGKGNELDIVINNSFADKATGYVNFLMDTSEFDNDSKEILYNGNPVKYERIDMEFANSESISANNLSSRYDFYISAKEFFGSKNIVDVTANYKRDFNEAGIWEPTLIIEVTFSKSYDIDYSQWTHFMAICRNRCLYRDIKMIFQLL
jgi:hypothetical protein